MGQMEVYEWLKNQRESGKEQYFTTKEVEKGLTQAGFSNGTIKNLRVDLIKLTVSGYLEMIDLDKSGLNNYNRVFRIKKVYCNGK